MFLLFGPFLIPILDNRVWHFSFKTSCFQNFSNFLDSNGFCIRNNLVSKKVWDLVSKIFGIEKNMGFGIGNIWYQKSLGFGIEKNYLFWTWFCKIWYRYWYRFQNFSNLFNCIGFGIEKIGIKISIEFGIKKMGTKKVLGSVLEIFGIKINIGFGIGKYLVLKKVSDSISEIFGKNVSDLVSFRFLVSSHTVR